MKSAHTKHGFTKFSPTSKPQAPLSPQRNILKSCSTVFTKLGFHKAGFNPSMTVCLSQIFHHLKYRAGEQKGCWRKCRGTSVLFHETGAPKVGYGFDERLAKWNPKGEIPQSLKISMAEMQGNRTPPRRFSRPTSVLKTEGCTSMPRTSAGNMSTLKASGKLQRPRSQAPTQKAKEPESQYKTCPLL